MSKVLVTGANGFVGQHLLKELAGHGIDVVAVGGPQTVAPLLGSDGNYLSLDLAQTSEAQKIDFSDISGVIHLAGLAAIGPSFKEPMHYIGTNVGIETNLFEAAIKQNAKPRFLIISSGTLYDPSAKLPLDETSPLLPNSPYAVSKIGQEEMAHYYSRRGFECTIARPFNHIGPGQNLGFLVPDIAQQIVKCEQGKLTEVLVGNLKSKRDYTDVRDIARAYRLLIEKGMPGETYNICSGTALSGHEILVEILKIAKSDPNIKQDPLKFRPSDNPILYGSHQKITEHTGWEPVIDIETTLRDVVTDWRQRV